MATFILPFDEYLRGWYEIEADTIEEARAIARAEQFTEYTEAQYRDGHTEWDENEIVPKYAPSEAYTIVRLPSWSDEVWAQVVEAIEKTTESFGGEN
jgi:hypothetical protein